MTVESVLWYHFYCNVVAFTVSLCVVFCDECRTYILGCVEFVASWIDSDVELSASVLYC